MTNKKIYKKIRKNGSWLSFLLLIGLSCVFMFALIFEYLQFWRYTFDEKLSDDFNKALYMKEIYERCGRDPMFSESSIYEIMDGFGLNYIITDREGKKLHITGEDTRNNTPVMGKITLYLPETEIYIDKTNHYMHVDNDGYLNINNFGFLTAVAQSRTFDDELDIITENVGILELGADKDKEVEYTDGFVKYYKTDVANDSNTIFSLPVWVTLNTDSKDEKLIVKLVYSVSSKEILLLIEIIIAFIILAGAVAVVIIINAIRNMIRQKMITSYFFKERVTEGKNWMYFLIKGSEIIRRYKKTKYAVVDMFFVNFRNYCVCHSLAEGERMLKLIYEAISMSISKKKELCVYPTSAHFAMLLKYEDREKLRERIEELIKMVEYTDPDHKFSFQCGVSLIEERLDEKGRAVKRRDIDIENEYNNANAARMTMSDTEESGISFFDDKIIEDQKWLNNVQEHQKKAIENEEFIVFYQPKYDPRTNELRGAEALIRWNSPDFGFVAPYKFIPIFEKNGFITNIDHYMLEHVARDQKRWLDAGFECVPVSVNVSRAHFIEDDLAEQILGIVDQAQCPHELIEIELTESAFFDDKRSMINTINKLKEYGFSVSMDDFGAGYSSLNSLKDMPLDVLKLDAEFFRGEFADTKRGEIVVSEAIKLAKSLNMRIVAEGVEIKEQVDFLAEEGCDMIQGYYYAKPMPGLDYEKKMKCA